MRGLFLSVALALCACSDGAPEPTPATPAEPTAGAAALRALAGSTPADARVRSAQARAKLQPDDAAVWVALGEAWIAKARDAQSGRLYDRAQDAAARALALKPGAAGALRVVALVQRNGHRFAEMKQTAERLAAAAPSDPGAWGLLGDAQLELGDYDAAGSAYQEMVDREPALPAFARIAWLRWLNGDVPGALEMWEEAGKAARQAAPETRAWVASEIGDLSWRRGDLTTARAAFDGALKAKPDHARSLFGRGRVRWAQGDLTGAVADLKASVAARRAEPVYAWLAALQREAGEAAAAAKVERMLSSADDYDDPRSAALYLATTRQKPARAVALAEADMKARGDIFAQDAMAFALLRAGRLDEAEKHAEAALRLGTPDPGLWARAGLVAAARADTATARARLTRALALNPKFDPVLADEVRDTLKRLPK